MSTARPLCTLFYGVLEQRTALLVGGEPLSGPFDQEFGRDGCGRPRLSGAALAGALLATARKLGHVLPGRLTGAHSQPTHCPSAWRVWNAALLEPEPERVTHEPRIHVAIRQDTGAAAENLLYDQVVLPHGHCWSLLLEISARHAGMPKDYDSLVQLARDVLAEWQAGRCWLGSGVASGLGWMQLTGLQMVTLDQSQRRHWPDNQCADNQTRFQRAATLAGGLATLLPPRPTRPSSAWHYAAFDLTLDVGAAPANGYGVDALSVGGFPGPQPAADLYRGHLDPPRGMDAAAFFDPKHFKPDQALAMTTRRGAAAPEPFIPGTAIRGPLRHTLSRLLRRAGNAILDPVTNQPTAQGDPVGELFGLLDARGPDPDRKPIERPRSAALLISDAHLDHSEGAPQWRAAWLQHHAEDEFTASTYGGAKFDRLVLLAGRFRARMVLEAPTAADLERLRQLLLQLRAPLEQSRIGFGGAQWAGLGWVRGSLTETTSGSATP